MEFSQKLELVRALLSEVGLDVEDIIRGYPDPPFYRRLLGLGENWTEDDENRLREVLRGTRHHRNHRDERHYAAGLLLGWIVQDAVQHLLSLYGLCVITRGTDARRELLPGREVSEEPDLQIQLPDATWWVDVVTDFPTQRGAPSYWQHSRRCHLRDNKFQRLMEKVQEGARVGLIGISVGTKTYFGMEFTPDLLQELQNPPRRNRRIYREETHWPYGGKPAIVLNLRLLQVKFRPFSAFPKGLPFLHEEESGE